MTRSRKTGSSDRSLGAPFLRTVVSDPEKFDSTRYPFSIPAFSRGIDLAFPTNVTFFVGENGSGKSTLLEALAECCGFNPEGGSRDHHRAALADRSDLGQALHLSWLPRVTDGFFMRAESFYNFASWIDQVSDLRAYGAKSLHQQSHGESFLALFTNRFEQGLYILDEPEAALSPQRQLAFSADPSPARDAAPRTVPHRDAFSDHSQLSRRPALQPRWRRDPTGRIPRDRALPRDPRLSQRPGALPETPF